MFKGSCVALITPFTEDGVNYEELRKLLEWHIKNHTDAILVCGTTGEGSTMTLEEKKEVIKFSVEVVNKRVPVIAGTGTNNTKASIELSQYAEKVGSDMVLIITPYYNKTSQKGLYAHFSAINDAINIPIMLYNVPSRTGMNITPLMLDKLADLNNVVAIKEASGDLSQVAKMAELCGDRIAIYSGNDDQIVPILSLGGAGVVSVLANILPEETHNICEKYFLGEVIESRNLQLKYLSLANSLFIETNPIPVKTAMNLMNFNCGPLRLPLCEMEDSNLIILEENLKANGLIK